MFVLLERNENRRRVRIGFYRAALDPAVVNIAERVLSAGVVIRLSLRHVDLVNRGISMLLSGSDSRILRAGQIVAGVLQLGLIARILPRSLGTRLIRRSHARDLIIESVHGRHLERRLLEAAVLIVRRALPIARFLRLVLRIILTFGVIVGYQGYTVLDRELAQRRIIFGLRGSGRRIILPSVIAHSRRRSFLRLEIRGGSVRRRVRVGRYIILRSALRRIILDVGRLSVAIFNLRQLRKRFFRYFIILFLIF